MDLFWIIFTWLLGATRRPEGWRRPPTPPPSCSSKFDDETTSISQRAIVSAEPYRPPLFENTRVAPARATSQERGALRRGLRRSAKINSRRLMMTSENESGPVQLPLASLQDFSPFVHCVWHRLDKPITREEISRALEQENLQPDPLPAFNWFRQKEGPTRQDHIRRIAFLVRQPDPTPILVDVGCPSLGCYNDWWIEDGNHRLAAAFYRKDSHISVLPGGELDFFNEIFGVDA